MTQRAVMLIAAVALEGCAAQASRGSRAGATISVAARVPPDAPQESVSDDAEIERRVGAQSAPLRQVHDAEAQRQMPDAPAEGTLVGGSSQPTVESARAADDATRTPEARDRSALSALPEIGHGLDELQAEYDIPIDVNDVVVSYVRFFQAPEIRPHFVRWLSRYHRYAARFRDILRREEVPEDTVYVAMVESGFANLATSRARAVGPWQFIADTGRRFGLRQDFWIDERRDPEKAARAAARFLRELYREHGDWRLAWAAYNAGPGRISRARKLGYSDFWDMAGAKRVLPRETRGYVPKIMAAAILVKHAEAFGFRKDEIEPERWVEYRSVVVPRRTELTSLAEAAEVPIDVLLDLNPELRRTCTPPRPYMLKIPHEKARVFAGNWPRISEKAARIAVARHRVRRGETLAAIARAYDVPRWVLARLNRLTPRRRIDAGTVLVVPLGAAARSDAEASARAAARGDARVRLAVSKAKTVRVEPGDSLWSLARRFGVTIGDLAHWNGIRKPHLHTLQAGRILVVRLLSRRSDGS